MRCATVVCVLAVLTALFLQATAPEPPERTVDVVSLVMPAVMYVGERVAVRATVIGDGIIDATRATYLCSHITGECDRTSRGLIDTDSPWTGFAGWARPQLAGAYEVEFVVHEDWGADSRRATTRVSMTFDAIVGSE